MTNPVPDPNPWRQIEDPAARLRQALTEVCPYFARSEAMGIRLTRDLAEVPVPREVLTPLFAYWGTVGDILANGWIAEDVHILRAAISHALEFGTWHSLVRVQGLREDQVIDLLVSWVVTAAGLRLEAG